MKHEQMETKLREALTLIQAALSMVAQPDDMQAVLDLADSYPGNLIPASSFYARLPFSRLKAAQLLEELGFTRVKKDVGIFWVKPDASPAPLA